MKRIVIGIIAIIIAIIIGIVLFFTFKEDDDVIIEELVKIPNVAFSLNDIKEKFLETNYAKNNNCSVNVQKNGLLIDCNKKYFFELEDSILKLEVSEKDDKTIFKEIVKVIETFYGSSLDEFEETLNNFINQKAAVKNLDYLIKNKKHILQVDTSGKISKYQDKESINNQEIITNKNDTFYKYVKNDYTIDDIEFIYDDDLNWIVFAGKLYGPDFKTTLNFKLYDQANNVIYEHKENFENYDNYNKTYISFVLNILLNEENFTYQDVISYSITLE